MSKVTCIINRSLNYRHMDSGIILRPINKKDFKKYIKDKKKNNKVAEKKLFILDFKGI